MPIGYAMGLLGYRALIYIIFLMSFIMWLIFKHVNSLMEIDSRQKKQGEGKMTPLMDMGHFWSFILIPTLSLLIPTLSLTLTIPISSFTRMIHIITAKQTCPFASSATPITKWKISSPNSPSRHSWASWTKPTPTPARPSPKGIIWIIRWRLGKTSNACGGRRPSRNSSTSF